MEKRNNENRDIILAKKDAKIQELQKEIELKRGTEEKLRESEEKFRIISEQSLMGIIIFLITKSPFVYD